MFRQIESRGFTGYYMNALGSLDDMLASLDHLVRKAGRAGVAL
jgi:hypothetical protein